MSFAELFIILVVGLIIIGPERLPQTIKSGMIWVNRIKRLMHETRSEFESQLGVDEIRREIHNEQVLASLKALEEAKKNLRETGESIGNSVENSIAPPESLIGKEPSAGQEPSADRKPSAGQEPSADKEPSAGKEPSADNKAPSADQDPSASHQDTTPAPKRTIREDFEDDDDLYGEQLANHPERKTERGSEASSDPNSDKH